MSIVRAYHAGRAEEIDLLLKSGSGLPERSARNNWLGRVIYFWDNDPSRAEYWQALHGKGAILECELETELLIDMLIDDQRSHAFLVLAKEFISTVGGTNDRFAEFFGRDGEVVNRLRPVFQSQSYCGIRMAFCLGDPIAADGNLFPNQHIQICLWDSSVIRNPKRYIPGLLSA